MTRTETFHPLRIDAPAITHHVEVYIRALADEHGGDGVVMGLSGGLDSALLATLAARALGPEKVRGQSTSPSGRSRSFHRGLKVCIRRRHRRARCSQESPSEPLRHA